MGKAPDTLGRCSRDGDVIVARVGGEWVCTKCGQPATVLPAEDQPVGWDEDEQGR